MRGDERRLTWYEQRASERARYADITARKVEYRRELRETGLAPQIATSLAAFRAAQERVDLRDAIANERAALKRELHLEQRQAWREFVTDRAHADDDAAISALRGLRYREQRVEREHDMETPDFALRGAGDASRASCGIFATSTCASSVTATSATDGATAARRFAIGGLRLRFATRAMQRRRGARARARQVGQQGHDSRQRRLQRACLAPRRRTRDTHQQSGTASSPARARRRTRTYSIARSRVAARALP